MVTKKIIGSAGTAKGRKAVYLMDCRGRPRLLPQMFLLYLARGDGVYPIGRSEEMVELNTRFFRVDV